MKSLVVFYSLTGNTSLVASKIAALLKADTERILCQKPYKGPWGYFKAAYHSLTGRSVPIQASKIAPHDYDLIVVAGPIWAGRIAPPVRSFLHDYRGHSKHMAFCVTYGGSQPDYSFRQMEEFSGIKPVATLSVTAEEITEGHYDLPVRTFVKTLQETLGQAHQDVA